MSVLAKFMLGISECNKGTLIELSGSGYRAFPMQFCYPGLLITQGSLAKAMDMMGTSTLTHTPWGELWLQGLS